MKRHILSILVIFASVLAILGESSAQSSFPRGKWWKHPEVLENIDLTDDQIQKIEKISTESMKKIIDFEARFKIAKIELESLLDQINEEKLDINALEKQIDILNGIKGDLDKERILMLARIRNVLPKETIEKLQKIRLKFRNVKREKRRSRFDEEFDEERH